MRSLIRAGYLVAAVAAVALAFAPWVEFHSPVQLDRVMILGDVFPIYSRTQTGFDVSTVSGSGDGYLLIALAILGCCCILFVSQAAGRRIGGATASLCGLAVFIVAALSLLRDWGMYITDDGGLTPTSGDPTMWLLAVAIAGLAMSLFGALWFAPQDSDRPLLESLPSSA
jgi:hypothetical protein